MRLSHHESGPVVGLCLGQRRQLRERTGSQPHVAANFPMLGKTVGLLHRQLARRHQGFPEAQTCVTPL